MKNLINSKTLKILLTVLLTILTSVVVYYIGDYFGYRAHLLEPSLVDNLIPQKTYFIYFYSSWYIMLVSIPLVLGFKDSENYKSYIKSIFISLFISLIIFIVYPTIMNRPVLIANNVSDKILSLIHIVSTPTKCIPSLHIVLSTLFIASTLSSDKLSKYYRICMIVISIGIIISTMFVKQHYFIDVITGIVVGVMSWFIAKTIKLKKC